MAHCRPDKCVRLCVDLTSLTDADVDFVRAFAAQAFIIIIIITVILILTDCVQQRAFRDPILSASSSTVVRRSHHICTQRGNARGPTRVRHCLPVRLRGACRRQAPCFGAHRRRAHLHGWPHRLRLTGPTLGRTRMLRGWTAPTGPALRRTTGLCCATTTASSATCGALT